MTTLFKHLIPHFHERSADCRSLGSPDFLSRVAASVNCVWFSLLRTTCVVAGESGKVGNPAALGMTKERAAVHREWLLNRGIPQI
jgi:hypothetical protein